LAVESPSGVRTYRQLNEAANQLSHWLAGEGIGPDCVVGLLLERSPEAVTAILATLKAGAAYAPMDPAYPAERLALMAEDACPRLIITTPELTPRMPTAANRVVLWRDIERAVERQPRHSPAIRVDDDQLAYVLFTSGSTGRPKGVAMRCGPLRHLLAWQLKRSTMGQGDGTLQFASLSFDVSFQEIVATWASGGRLVLPPESLRRDPAGLARYLADHDIRRLFVPFVMLQQLAESGAEPPACLREVITAGEQLQITPAVRRFFERMPGCTLDNQYGPTESHVVTAYRLSGPPADWPTLPPIGRPVAAAIIELLDDGGERVADGDTGEIWIGGDCLARDYIGRPDLTRERFLPDPRRPGGRLYRTGDLGRRDAAGEIHFLGRRDQQVKIRGYRVEPGEVEAALCAHPAIREAAVVAREDAPADPRLVAYIVTRAAAPTVDDLRAWLSRRLPDYMIPAAFVALPDLPLTPSGKVDRQALPAPARDRPELAQPLVPPRTKTELAIARVWQEILRIDEIGIYDPFFDLGGHSLALARVHAQLTDLLGIKLPLAALFQHATIAGLAAAIDGQPSARRRLESRPRLANDPVAVVGFAGRFPGAASVESFWDNLCHGVESIRRFTDEQLRAAGIPDELIADSDYVKARGVLELAEFFDAGFFSMQPREAELTDPQQRIFLEACWTALEHAGYIPERCGGPVGVFAGCSMNTYLIHNVFSRPGAAAEFAREFQSGGYPTLVGNDKDYLATRVAYKLNLRGPAVSVQTACSTSLVAICQAVASLRSGQCDFALAGGVSVTFPQCRGSLYQDGAITSPDGHCRPFDSGARGTVFGEGVGVVVLKRLADALSDRDTVYAVIRGVGLSNDGSDKLSYLAPGAEGQVEAVTRALVDADIDPSTIGYVEAHGTGTPMGDPVEVNALSQALGRNNGTACYLGSVKGNVGHLEAAAGVTGFIKATLALGRRRIPGTLHFRQPHSALELERTTFRITAEAVDWTGAAPRRAGVTSLGVGGTNAHVILEEAPPTPPDGPSWPQQLFVLSARSATALERATDQLAAHLQATPDLNQANTAYTLQIGRRAFEHRRFVVAERLADAANALLERDPHRVHSARAAPRTSVGFLFPGQGSQAAYMTDGLYRTEPTFRATIDHCADLLRPHFDLLRLLYSPESEASINQTQYTQPALFAVEYALAQMWMGWGVRPDVMIGHSIGEYVAACLAGVFTLADALAVVVRRGEFVQSCPTGVMLAVRAGEEVVQAILPSSLDIAAVNGPAQCVVAGPETAVAEFEAALVTRAIPARRLVTSHAFHSAALEPAVAGLRNALVGVTLRPPRLPFVSCVTGRSISDDQATSPEYWATQLRTTVRFADGVAALPRPLTLLEVGPGRALTNLARQNIPAEQLTAVPSLPADSPSDDVNSVLNALGRLWLAGIEPDWSQFHALAPRRRVPLPTHPFERQRYWIEPIADTRPAGAATDSAVASVCPKTVPSEAAPAAGTTLPAVRELFGELAGISAEALDPSASFVELGFDSLGLTQAVHAVQSRFGVRVSFRQLLETFRSPTELAEHIDRLGGAPKPAPASPPADRAPQPEPVAFGAAVAVGSAGDADWPPRQLRFLRAFTERYARRTAKSKQHVQHHRRHHADPRTVSGFTPLWKEIVYPIVVDRSAGSRLWDIDGNEYIDLLNGFGPDLLGHSPPAVVESVAAQLRRGYEGGPLSPLAGELAQTVCAMTGLDRASFVCTGSEAVQAALRAARTVTGRDKVVTFARDYHGNFDEVLVRPAVGDGGSPATPSAPGVPRSAVANMIVLEYGTAASLEVIRSLGPELAAVLVEPVQSRRPELQPREFLHELRRITRQHDAALIFDEVITGFRLHPGGAQAYFGVRADLATYGKIVGGGMPIGIVAGQARFMDAFDGGDWQYGDDSIPAAGRTFFAGTFVRHPLALAAGLATLRQLQADGPALQQALNARADRFCNELSAVLDRHAVPIELANCGSLLFFRVTGGNKEASLLFYLLRERGVFLLEGFPAYLNTAHTDADLHQVVESFDLAAGEMRAHGFFGGVAAPPPHELVPLTDAQNEIWLASQASDDASRAFNESCDLHLIGPFDEGAFFRAVGQLLARHEALRSSFDASGAGQRFHPDTDSDVPLIDLTGAPDATARLAELKDQEDRIAFDLTRGPLLRVRVVRMGADDHHVLLTAHHIACDGWSYDIILRELGVLYSSAVSGTPPALPAAASFRDYAEHYDVSASDRAYWRSVFADIPEPLALPADHPRPSSGSFRGTRIGRDLGNERSARVRRCAVGLGSTPYSLLFAAFDALLSRLTGQHDLVVGIPVAGQNFATAPNLVGHCVHFLPIRQRVAPHQPFAGFAADVQKTLLDAFDHQNLTYVTLLRDLPDDTSRRPSVNVGFNVDPPLSDLSFTRLDASVTKNPKHFVNLDLHWNLVDSGSEYAVEAEFNTELLDAATVLRWIEAYFELLDNATQSPNTPVAELRVVSDADRSKMLVDWNATSRPIPCACIHQLFEAQVRQRPDALALLSDVDNLTYAQLDHRAERLARVLVLHGVGPNVPVAVLLPRRPDLIVAMLAIIRAGGAYLPLDPTHPPGHHARLIAAARSPLIIITPGAEFPDGVAAIDVNSAPADGFGELPVACDPDALAAILFTSGSTGAPNGVMVTHRNVVRLLYGNEYCDFGPARTFAFLAPIAFDAATFEIWGALLHGGRLAIYPDAVPDPVQLDSFLKQHAVDTLWLTAGLFNAVVDHNPSALSGIRQLLTGGEAVSPIHVRRALAALPDITIIDGYGPTETTTFATTFTVPRPLPPECANVPIGRPIGNTSVAVLDAGFQPVPIGVVGELFIGGAGVTRGYVNEPRLTAERFMTSPVPELPGRLYRTGDRVRWRADGILEYCGRTDRQLKIRGQRIEPSEVEACLAEHPGVAAAAVDVHGSGTDARLVAYATLRPGATCSASELQAYVASQLPAAMRPADLVLMDALPLTANGKLDRAALPVPPRSADRPAGAVPSTDAQRELLAIWREVLDAPHAGVTDDFFDLGGHSLKAIALIATIRDRLGHALPLGTLYRAPTVESLAAMLQRQLEAGSDQSLVPLQAAGGKPPLFLIAGVGGHVFAFHKFARLLGSDQPAYGVKAIGVDGARTPPDTVEATAAEYVREITAERPHGPCILAGYSIGAGIALETALQLRALGRAVPLVIAFDAAAPQYMSFSWPHRLRLHFSNLFLRGGGWRYAGQRLRNLQDRWNWATGRAHRNAPRIEGLEMFSQSAIDQVWIALHRAYRNYTPTRRFDGRVLVVRAEVLEDWDKFVSADPALGWSRWTRQPVESVSLPVRHLELFHEPAIRDVARAVRSAIDACQQFDTAGHYGSDEPKR